MVPFIPRLSEHTANLRDLLKKGIEYIWTNSHEEDFQQIKTLISKEITLAYFDPTNPTTIQIDASCIWEQHYYKLIGQLHSNPNHSLPLSKDTQT